jgi:hypothetical protein
VGVVARRWLRSNRTLEPSFAVVDELPDLAKITRVLAWIVKRMVVPTLRRIDVIAEGSSRPARSFVAFGNAGITCFRASHAPEGEGQAKRQSVLACVVHQYPQRLVAASPQTVSIS